MTLFNTKRIAAAGLGLAMAVSSVVANAQEADRAYEVSITNIMSNNQLTPVFSTTHNGRGSIFTVGSRARRGLAMIAETGSTAALQDELSGNDNFGTVQTTPFPGDVPLIFAGNTLEFTIESGAEYPLLSIASMILPTNDSFIGLDSVALPTSGTATYYSVGYDAGTEENNEICTFIPGPTCGGSGEFNDLGNGEGFVHVSRGIQGVGDLGPIYDWRNPTAKIEITRIR